MTGSLVSSTLFSHRDANCICRSSILRENCDTDWSLPLLDHTEGGAMDADGFSIVDNRAGITFGVELYVPWDAPEMVIDLPSTGTVPLQNVPDVFGMSGRRDSATESRILQGRDARSVRVLVPDCRGLDQNFHDVTVVDMGDLPESQVSIPELSELAKKWPPAVIAHMRWRQPELEEIKQADRVQYRKKQPAQCDFCSTMIRCDMYRHMAHCHLDLAQLWCTVWKGAPQDLMDHVRGAHKVPEEVQNIKLETLIPPWTVTRKMYMESLTSRHSRISNDILLFSDIGLSLAHHYRVHKRGIPHVAFRKIYMSQLRALLPLPAAPLTERGSQEPGCSSMEDSSDAVGASSRPSRRAFACRRITRVRETPRRVAPRLTEQDPLAVAEAMVLDCRPQVLPGAMDVSGTELTEIRSMTRARVATAAPPEREQSFGGGGGFAGFDLPEVGRTVQITFIFIGQTRLVFGKCVCTCVTKHSNAFRTFLNWLKNSKRVWHEPKLHISRLPLFANFDL